MLTTLWREATSSKEDVASETAWTAALFMRILTFLDTENTLSDKAATEAVSETSITSL